MDIFLQQILNGLVLGSVYALVALGYTMVYGILGLINFAHGEVVMVGALVSLSVIELLLRANLGIPIPVVGLVALLVAIGVCMALGFSIERVAYRPLRRAPRLAPLITAIGVSILLQTVAMLIWGRRYHTVPALIPATPHTLGGATITNVQILIIVVSALLMVGLMGLVHFTRLGRAMRATAENPVVAGLMGVNINRIVSATFVIGSALAAIAGVLVSSNYGIAHYYMGFVLGLKAFTAAVLGGIGNLPGAMVGGLLLGLIESLGAGYVGDLTGGFLGSNYQDVFAFMVLIMVLVFRPTGLLGERVSERA
ncbi:MAG TPA: branched-chain amino acid ABC transporter permease [Burkholderiales bacterium]|nr:branched-chain amino acid ABC transporter permease [Burkholderiales bacterium]